MIACQGSERTTADHRMAQGPQAEAIGLSVPALLVFYEHRRRDIDDYLPGISFYLRSQRAFFRYFRRARR